MIININNRTTTISDENEELLDELVARIINEDVSGKTGKADFDINSINVSPYISGTLNINYELFEDAIETLFDPLDKTLLEHADEDFPDIDGQIEAMEP